MKITMDGKYQTRSGLPVRIYAVDGGVDGDVHGAFLTQTFGWRVMEWAAEGKSHGECANLDLIPCPSIAPEVSIFIGPDGAYTVSEFLEGVEPCQITLECVEGKWKIK